MAFDQPTRNRLARFVSDTRTLLAEEFTRQLQNDYGLDPDSGDVTDLERLEHLDDARRETARLLRDTMAHYLAAADTSTPAKAQKARRDVLARIIREQAFTILNRLCALRMAEARGLLIESIARGYQSKGFQLYQHLAGTALGETGACYRLFIFSVFDEFAVDLPVLFGRFSPQGRLFPREATLLRVLEEINHPDIDPLWAEDETIGWIYQYFNSVEERRQMRAASQAPRNSRELAVRNQFFTPRYVVEFLTDNTLGRIWYEMTGGKSALRDSCRYLVRRPNEIFLAEGEAAPEQEDSGEELTQEELLQQPVHILHRPLKDPRDIKMLDPACGSMHFGLYAFDLFERIYEEAWELEARRGADGLVRTEGLKPLHESYNDRESFLRDVPRLIIERNIHGIDIDPRAVQIAGLSLWLRAQRSWQAQNVKALDRPRIQRSNIVCAEPMPGETDMLEEFAEQLQPKVLGQLVRIIFEKMKLAGEAGSLLKIEEEIKEAVSTAHAAYRKHLLDQKKDAEYLPGMAPEREGALFDFADLPEVEDFWASVELRVIDALRAYAEQAESGAYQRRLFANDAARGFAFIDLCRKRYDVVLMNPPFGKFSKLWSVQSKTDYPNSANDILGAFVERFLNRLHDKGRLGAITSRTCFFLTTFTDWRRNVILRESAVRVIADLGQGVMDNAMVEAAAYVLESTQPSASMTVFRSIADADRQLALKISLEAHNASKSEARLFLANQQTFDLLPDSPFVYWIDNKTIRQFDTGSTFEPDVGAVRVGLQTGDDPRYVRAVWEVPYENTIFCYYPSNGGAFCSFEDPIVQSYFRRRHRGTPKWAFHVKSGTSQPWYSPVTLKLNYERDGTELRNFRNDKGKPKSSLRSTIMYYRPGFSWTLRAPRLYPYVVPGNCIPSVSRYMAFPNPGLESEAIVLCASRIASSFLRFYAEKFEWPKFLVEWVKRLPWPQLPNDTKAHFDRFIVREVEQRRLAYQNHEPFHEFLLPGKIRDFSNNGQSLAFEPGSLLDAETEKMIADAYGFSEKQARAVERDLLEAISYLKCGGARSQREDEEGEDSEGEEADSDFVLDHSQPAQEEAHLSYLLGTVLGRWDIRYATGERQPPELPDPFDPLPVCPPGMLQNAEGLPAEPKDVPADYPLRISWSGILVDDENHVEYIVARVREAIAVIWKERSETIEQEACEILGVKSLRDYFQRPANFFADHLKRYSKSRRVAPIYWPLSTPSGSYTLWLYYHRLSDQTLYTCVNDFVDPKLKQVSADAASLRGKSNRSSAEEKELERLSDVELELKDFRDELLRIARFWKPNLNDGVQITAAPLWNLFQHRQWKARLKETWLKLEAGEYDWAHLALSIWPDRVVRASHKDRSYAIAHDLEDQLWHEVEVEKAGRGGRVAVKVEWRPRELSEAELAAIIKEKAGSTI